MGKINYVNGASSFWLTDAFDVASFKDQNNRIDYTKLASTQRAIANFVNIVTGKQIPVEFQTNSDTSYTDGRRVVIGTNLNGKNFDSTVGLALHEGSHIVHTKFDILSFFSSNIRLRGVDPNLDMTDADELIIKNLLNWVEDRRIDYLIYTKAPGYRMYYDAMYDKYFNDRAIDKALKDGIKNKETLEDYFFHIINFTNPNRNLNELEILLDIWNLIDLKNISRLENTTDALDVACNIYKKLKKHLKEKESPEEDCDINDVGDTTNPGGSAKSTDSVPEEDGDINDVGDTPASADTTNPDGSVENTADLTPRQKTILDNAILRQKQFLSGNIKKPGKLNKGQSNIIRALKEAGTESMPVDLGDEIVDTVIINKLTTNIIETLPELFGDLNNPNTQQIQCVETGIRLGKILGRKLNLRNENRTLKHTRLVTGKIDRRLLSQLGYDNVNVFHRIVADQYKDYFIHISIDASGSMWGIKFRRAITSAIAIAQAASMTTGIRIQISLRGTACIPTNGKEKCVTIIAYDSAVDKMIKIRRLFKYLTTFGLTPEGVAFTSIEKSLRRAGNGVESIFINYSDGYPTSCGGRLDPALFTRNTIKRFREHGIGILSYFISQHADKKADVGDTFKYMYGPDAKNIDPENMLDVAKTINSKFLEKS